MVLLAYGGLSSSVLLSTVAALWMLGVPGNAIVPVAVQLAAGLLAVAMAVDLAFKPFARTEPAQANRRPRRSRSGRAPSLAPLLQGATTATAAKETPPPASVPKTLLKPIPRARR